MKKTILLILILLQAQAAAASIWVRDVLTGGSAGAIDAISSIDARADLAGAQPLNSHDLCVTKVDGVIYYYSYDPASTLPELPPTVIAPDDIGGNPGRWLRIPPFIAVNEIPGLAAVASSGDYNDLLNLPTTITTAESAAIIANTAHAAFAHAPANAEQNVNADWAAAPGGDDYILNKPVIPSSTSQLTNDAGFIASESDPVFAGWDKSSGIIITESQISDLTHTIDTHLTESQVDAYVNNNGYSTGAHTSDADIAGMGYIKSYTESDPLTNALGKANLPCTEGQIPQMVSGVWTCAAAAADLSTKTTSDLIEGTNLYYTDTRVSANSTVAANTAARHTHSNETQLDAIDQDLSTTASPTFAGVTINGADGDRALSLLDNTVAVPCLTGDYRLYPQNGVWKRCEDGTVTDVGAGATSGDMLKSIYDADADNLIDDTAIAASIARDSEIPTDNAALTNGAGYITGFIETNPGAEPALGNPAVDGYVLSSTAAGIRSWVAGGGGTVDLSAPGPIGATTPDIVNATDIFADTITVAPPVAGETGEIALPEDPANSGGNLLIIKAQADIAADMTWYPPIIDGTAGDVWATDGAGVLSMAPNYLTESQVDGYCNNNGYLTSYTETDPTVDTSAEIATILNTSPSTTINEAVIDSTIARDSELNLPVAAPTLATDTCTAGQWAYDSSYHYICVAADTWMRAALATW